MPRYLFYNVNIVAITHNFHKYFCIQTLHGIAFSFRVSAFYNWFFINNCFNIKWQVIANISYADVIIVVNCLCIFQLLNTLTFSVVELLLVPIVLPSPCYVPSSGISVWFFCPCMFVLVVLVVLLKQNICGIKPRLRFYLNTGGCLLIHAQTEYHLCQFLILFCQDSQEYLVDNCH